IHDAQKLILPPYYPDTPKAREAWAAYYDIVTITDQRIGELLQEIDDAGLRDETIVLFWGDHGVGLARGKRWLYDSGVKVPLIVRWPGKIEPGSVRLDLVQFLDLAPTMLALADVPKPDYMQGRVILGDRTEAEPRYLFHERDRMDERFDIMRAVRDRRYKYIRNFESHKPWVQFMRTPSQGPMYQELGKLKDEGKLDQLTAPFMEKTKPYEELYDTLVDPYEMHNLADDPDYAARLETMRDALVDWMMRTGDVGLVPEPETLRSMYPHNKRERMAPPTAETIAGGKVKLSAAEDASIAYTFDEGKQPHWSVYTAPVAVPQGKHLRAIAVRLGYSDSEPVVAP
ncbi:MAG: sulfatase-like hydrolase/transferase, partial [Acidobacteria bacterium]|nr:sulfatase-like hydrolase/transferase [Acidobacteriota bacterium]